MVSPSPRPSPSQGEGEKGDKVDSSGAFMLAGFGLMWTLASTCFFGLITLASLGLIGVENGSGSPPNLTMFGVMLAMFSPGPALLYVGGAEVLSLHHSKALRLQFPGMPWKWTSQWTGGVIQAGAASEAFWSWYFAIALALFLVPGVVQLWVIDPDWRGLVLLPFLAIDFLLFRHAWRRTRSAHRYGKLALRISQLPLRLGDAFDVLLEVPAPLEGQATLRLHCSVRVTTGSGKNKTTHSEIVFEKSIQVPIQVSGQRSIIRGQLQLPEKVNGSDWNLEITAENVDELFVLPVFQVHPPAEVERFPLAQP